MESVGAKLKKIRLEKGISLEEVYKKTKIHLNILKAIEEDSLINFNPVYIKGFLKIYCKFLGVEPKDYITDYQDTRTKFEPIYQKKQKPISLLKTVSLKFTSLKFIKIAKRAFLSVFIIIFVVFLFNLGRIIALRRASLRKQNKLPVTVSVKKEKRIATTKSKKGQAAIAIHNEQRARATSKLGTASGQRLTIRAKENCWIQVKIDGKIVFQNILMKGRAESWQAKDKIEFSVGNAAGVDLEVNGKLISNLGKRGQPLKNILITKDGLNISR